MCGEGSTTEEIEKTVCKVAASETIAKWVIEVASVVKLGCFAKVTAPPGGEPARDLMPVSEMAVGRVEDPTKLVTVGDDIKERLGQRVCHVRLRANVRL